MEGYKYLVENKSMTTKKQNTKGVGGEDIAVSHK